MKSLLPMTAFLVLAVVMHADVRGQDSSAPPPEMKPLERLVGTWKVDQTVKVPKEERSTVTVKREPILGGRFVQETGGFDDQGKPTFMGMYTYDSNRNTYRFWFYHSSGFCWEPTGTGDESSQTLTFKDDRGALTFRFLDETTIAASLIFRDEDGKTTLHLEAKAVRQK